MRPVLIELATWLTRVNYVIHITQIIKPIQIFCHNLNSCSCLRYRNHRVKVVWLTIYPWLKKMKKVINICSSFNLLFSKLKSLLYMLVKTTGENIFQSFLARCMILEKTHFKMTLCDLSRIGKEILNIIGTKSCILLTCLSLFLIYNL